MATAPTSSLDGLASRLYAAVISDALDTAGSRRHNLDPRIRPVAGAGRLPVVGRAATARAVQVEEPPTNPYSTLLEAIDQLNAGDVWVVATQGEGEVRSAIFGGLLATAALSRGAVACVVDGAVRDTRELERLEFPTFATGFSPADSLGRDEVIEFGEPVSCGGIQIEQGQLIVADYDGIVAVPHGLENRVIDHALEKIQREREMKGELAAGMPVREAFARYGIL